MIIKFDKFINEEMYSESDYNCPHCGWEMDYNDPDLIREDYGYRCPQCGEHFETPDV